MKVAIWLNLLVFVGAGLGGVLRYMTQTVVLRWFSPWFPWSTLGINVVGSLVMGIVAGLVVLKAGDDWAQDTKLFVMTGVLGGFTTFSSFSLDAVTLWRSGGEFEAVVYVMASVVLSIAALMAGLGLARAVT